MESRKTNLLPLLTCSTATAAVGAAAAAVAVAAVVVEGASRVHST